MPDFRNLFKQPKHIIFMKRLVWALIFLISLISVSASYFPAPGISLEYKEGKCYNNGSILLNITHSGENVAFGDIKLIVEGNHLSPQELVGQWYIGDFPTTNYEYPFTNYTGTDFQSPKRFNFRTTNNIFTEGRYVINMTWPSRSPYDNHFQFAIECPGKVCNNDNNCVSQQSCVNNKCEWLDCGLYKYASGHACLDRCNDNNECTQDYFIDNQCVHVKIDKCVTVEEKVQTENQNIFERFWNWLKSRYN